MKFEGVTAVIPACNEAMTVGSVVGELCSSGLFQEVLVVDSLSEDATSEVARDAGARVVRARQSGLGAAMAAGVNASTTDRIFRTDADISDWNFGKIAEVATGGSDLMRGVFDSPYDDFPVTRLVAENICAVIFPGLKLPPRCLSGTYAFSRSKFPPPTYPPGWAFDIALVLAAVRSGWTISNVDIGTLVDRPRPIEHYVPMARDIVKYVVDLGR